MPRQGKSKVLALSEFEHLIEITKKSHRAKRNLAMVHFSYGLGLRAKEIASLKIQDVTDGQKIFEEINLKKTYDQRSKTTHYLSSQSISARRLNRLYQSQKAPKRPTLSPKICPIPLPKRLSIHSKHTTKMPRNALQISPNNRCKLALWKANFCDAVTGVRC